MCRGEANPTEHAFQWVTDTSVHRKCSGSACTAHGLSLAARRRGFQPLIDERERYAAAHVGGQLRRRAVIEVDAPHLEARRLLVCVIDRDRHEPRAVARERRPADGGEEAVRYELRSGLAVPHARGLVDTRTHQLDVSGGIRVTSDDGYDARTPAAKADLKAGTVRGENGIEATGTFGRITADRFTMNRETQQRRFTGNVRMLLNGVPAKQ